MHIFICIYTHILVSQTCHLPQTDVLHVYHGPQFFNDLLCWMVLMGVLAQNIKRDYQVRKGFHRVMSLPVFSFSCTMWEQGMMDQAQFNLLNTRSSAISSDSLFNVEK